MLSSRIQRAVAATLTLALYASDSSFGFTFTDLHAPGSEALVCDLDGDGLKDVVVVEGIDISIFYHDRKQGFIGKTPLKFRLPDQPSLLWSAQIAGEAESLLTMTSDGVTAFSCTNRNVPPHGEQIINQATFIPDRLDETRVFCVPMSAHTGPSTPVIVVPTGSGIDVWQNRGDWKREQTIDHPTRRRIQVGVTPPGYAVETELHMSLGDINGDGRDDLVLFNEDEKGRQVFTSYFASTSGLFTAKSPLIYTMSPEDTSWVCWADINQDGKTDLLKTRWLDEPTFIPGTRSGKVLVSLHFADAAGEIVDQPNHVFRKHDWTPSVPAVDIDGDGYLDLVLGYSLFDSREGVRKMLSAKQLDLNLKFHFYQPNQGYSVKPDARHDLLIHLNREAIALSWSRRRYFEQFVSLEGDFNGDGRKDLLVRERGDRIAVYFFQSKRNGFASTADLLFRCPESAEEMRVAELNGDQISDLIVASDKGRRWRIFTSGPK